MFNGCLVEVEEGREENERISHLGREILFLRKPPFSDRIRQTDTRLASSLGCDYIPRVDGSSSLASCIVRSDHYLFDPGQPVGRT